MQKLFGSSGQDGRFQLLIDAAHYLIGGGYKFKGFVLVVTHLNASCEVSSRVYKRLRLEEYIKILDEIYPQWPSRAAESRELASHHLLSSMWSTHPKQKVI